MAQSGRSLSDSAARPGRNDVVIKVTLLDGEDKSFRIDVSAKKMSTGPSNCLLQRRVTAETVIHRVLKEFLDIEEKEYFSLYYLDNNHRVRH